MSISLILSTDFFCRLVVLFAIGALLVCHSKSEVAGLILAANAVTADYPSYSMSSNGYGAGHKGVSPGLDASRLGD